MSKPCRQRGRAALIACSAGLLCSARAAADFTPYAVVSLEGCTLRLETGQGRRIFPVGVGRLLPNGREQAHGVFYTGPDPADRHFYLPSRDQPAFHRGLPFLRLDRRVSVDPELPSNDAPFGIHGPVTPTLIWGRVSAGCLRMRAGDLRWLYEFATAHPGLQLRFTAAIDLVDGRPVTPMPERIAPEQCPEAGLGVRRLRRARQREFLHDRICGGVDHWWAIELKGGDRLRARLQHHGTLQLELYGIRGISQVAAGRFGFEHTVPLAQRNRGDRYLRITAASSVDGGGTQPYALELSVD